MLESSTLRSRLRNSHLGAIGIALLFWESWQQAYAAVRPILGGACLRLLNHYIHFSPQMVPVLSSYKTIWKFSLSDLWIGFLFGVVALMTADWLYAPEKQR